MRAFATLLVLTFAAGCLTPDGGDTPPTPTTPAGVIPEAIAVSLVEGPEPGIPPRTLGIDPSTLELVAGKAYNLTVTNAGAGTHNLVIDGLDVATADLAAGESESILFTPAEAGTYRMWCTIGGEGPLSHSGRGMEGEVVVS